MTCECPNCNCAVTKENDVEKDGKHYCCTACAEGHPDVRYLRQRVRAQPSHPWSVADIAAERGVSSRELQRRCRQATGYGPKRLILKERHLAAEHLLRDGHATVAEVAAQFGFSESAAFSRSFTSVRGYPPSRCQQD